MAFGRIGINLLQRRLAGRQELAEDLRGLETAGLDFVEVASHGLDMPWWTAERRAAGRSGGGARLRRPRLDVPRSSRSRPDGPAGYARPAARRAGIERAVCGQARAPLVVCHAGKRVAPRDARHRLDDNLAAQRDAFREIGEVAGGLGVTIAAENSYPEPPIVRETTYAYAAWPSGLAGQVAAVDHPVVGICLDVGHAAVAASFFGFDYLKECAAAAPLVHHVHLHDNLGRPDLAEGGESRVSERLTYGVGDLHLPPGKGAIPLEALFRRPLSPRTPTCCMQLFPGLRHLAKEALASARELLKTAGSQAAIQIR